MTAATTASTRVHGLDVARAIAMIGMLVAHFVEAGTGSGLGALGREFVDGRAMPLFMVLGGVGISFLALRSPDPDRDLLARAVILLPMGLLLQEFTTDIAIILQYYALFFVVAIPLRRLPDRALLVAALGLMALGAYSKQVWAPQLTSYGGWEGARSLLDPGLWWSLVVTGYYPLLPAGAFLTTGMWLGRQDLRSHRVVIRLAIVGAVLAIAGSWIGAWIGDEVGASGVVIDGSTGTATLDDDLMARYAEREALTVSEAGAQIDERFPANPAGTQGLENLADSVERTTPGFRWERLFDAEGHSQMPAWVVGSTGSALLVIAVSLVAATGLGLTPLAILGEMALTFYVYQAVVINWTPPRPTTTTREEYLLCLLILLAFLTFAYVWRRWRRRGPFEMLLRLGSASPQ